MESNSRFGDSPPTTAANQTVVRQAPDRVACLDAKGRDSQFVRHHSGFTVFRDLFSTSDFEAILDEASERYREGSEGRVELADGSDGPGGPPRRRLITSNGGAAQDAVYQSADLRRFLTSLCGIPVTPAGRLGSFNYYTRDADFMGLHLDVDPCDLVVLTVLKDHSKPNDPGGATRVYPRHLGRSLSSVRRDRGAGAVTLKLLAGQSIVMFGGLVPHEIVPVHAGQRRIVSALCFRAGGSDGCAL